MVNAYRTGELSLVYPLMRGVAPLITAVLGILWLRELPAPISWLGMLMISVGVIALALRPAGNAPVLAGHGRAVGFALANAAVIATYTIIDGTGARLAGDPWAYIVWLFVLDSIPFSLYMLVTRRRGVRRRPRRATLAWAYRRRAVGWRLRNIRLGNDQSAGGTGCIAPRNICAVCHADRRAIAEGKIDRAALGRGGGGGHRSCSAKGGLNATHGCNPGAEIATRNTRCGPRNC